MIRAPRSRTRLVSAALAAALMALAAVRTHAAQPLPDLVSATPAAPDEAGAALLEAHAALADGDAERIAALAVQVSGSPLESYLSYWQASLALRATPADAGPAREFLARNAGTVLADRLRADWLLVLGAAADWTTFDAERRRLVLASDDPQLACYALLARYALDDGHRREAIARDARRTLASTTEPGGDGCTALAERLLDDGQLSIWPRLQALVERNQLTAAAKAAERMPRADANAMTRLLERPGAWLAAVEAHLDTMPHPFPLLAIVALARDAPEPAAHYAQLMDAKLTPEERAMVWGRIGRMAQLALLPQAHEWFQRAGDLLGASIDSVRVNETLEARARAALRRGAGTASANPGPDWPAVARDIAAMPPELQGDSTWTYWNAQALLAQGKAEEGRAALRLLADRFSYYGRLAAERLDLPLVLAPAPPQAPAALVDELAQRPGFARARLLYQLGLREEANREWNWELRGMDDATLHAAAELGRRIGAPDRMISAAERARGLVDIAQRYPTPHRQLMMATTAPLGVDPAWIYGLIRQESRFIEDIRSNAGAIGLMQLMPSTARFVAHRIGYENYRADRISEVGTNLRLGTEYLKLIFDDQDGQPLLATAAYNAGPARVRRWRAALARPLDGAIFVETIPIAETREYVKRVLFNTVVYGALLEHRGPALRTLLAPVAPKSIPADDLP